MATPIIFTSPPKVPENITGALKFQLDLKSYKQRTRSVLYIFLEIIGALFVVGLLWIGTEWIRLGVTIVAILMALMLLISLMYVL